ncbi:hypothetical protein [Roseibium aggregatum]|uniref:hypothetical protein n=1 Tax=Roseibium aggregatum TaxID=187304 RepID=UPI001E30FD0A|nr:hypothetical protein [Roseibium aggregatum]UES42199.1 hypothetical protein GFC08_29810 [Roseibium aggregatum]UES42264.1 hypothetical protein GFC08_30180 [Roseibium aggregatum]
MNITAFPRRPKSPKPLDTKTWCVPVNFVFDDGTALSLRLAEKSVQSLENRLWSEDNERHFVIFQTVEEVVALNARRLTHWTPDMEELSIVEYAERREEDEDEPEPVSVHCANLAGPIQLWCVAEKEGDERDPVRSAMIDLDDADSLGQPFLRVTDSSLQPYYFRTNSVLLFRVPQWIIPCFTD